MFISISVVSDQIKESPLKLLAYKSFIICKD